MRVPSLFISGPAFLDVHAHIKEKIFMNTAYKQRHTHKDTDSPLIIDQLVLFSMSGAPGVGGGRLLVFVVNFREQVISEFFLYRHEYVERLSVRPQCRLYRLYWRVLMTYPVEQSRMSALITSNFIVFP